MTGNPEVIILPVGLVPTNAPAVTDQFAGGRLPGTYPHDAPLDYFRIADKPEVRAFVRTDLLSMTHVEVLFVSRRVIV